MNYLKGIGFGTIHDRVYPDLVFSLPSAAVSSNGTRIGRRRVAGIGLMLYAGKYSVSRPRPETYLIYLESLTNLAEWLLSHDYDIRLLTSDGGDTVAIEEFKSLLRSRLGTRGENRVLYERTASVEDVLSQLAATDVVIATRFHNVLFSMLLTKPVLAISFHHKCASLMSDMGLSEYCHDINQIDSEILIKQFLELERNSEKVRRITAERLKEARRALDEQYEILFKSL